MTPSAAARTLAGRASEVRRQRSRESSSILSLPCGVRVELYVPRHWMGCPRRDLLLIHKILELIEAHEKPIQEKPG